jgi:hypothetical protein
LARACSEQLSAVGSPGLILRLSIGLAVLYGLVIIVWYELLRSTVMARRRGDEAQAVMPAEDTWEGARSGENGSGENGSGENGRARAQPPVSEELELERARRHYHFARHAAKAERDAAIEAASAAAEAAIERIERRHREIDEAFIDEETNRISELLGRLPGER